MGPMLRLHSFLLVCSGFLATECLVFGFLVPASSFATRGDPREAASGISYSSGLPLGMSPSIPTLEDWEVMEDGSVVGTVSNHPSIDDGDMIATSPIDSPNRARPEAIVTTMSGSQYKLGAPSPPKLNGRLASQNFFGKISQSVAVNPEQAFRNAQRVAHAQFRRMWNSPFVDPPPDDRLDQSDPDATNINISEEDLLLDAKHAAKQMYETALMKAQRAATSRYNLNGLVIGRYLLSGSPIQSTSGKSQIWTAYQSDTEGLPTGGAVVVKVSSVTDALHRESVNYHAVTRGFTRGQFVNCLEYYPDATEGCSDPRSKRQFLHHCALVMEKGSEDLKTFVARHGYGAGLKGPALRDAAMAAAQCLQALHSANMVWTDLKTENFIVVDEGTTSEGSSILVKGIDLESAMPVGDNPVDYSPEACPPEFAEAFLSGSGPYFALDYSYDVWSYGMMLYEIATGDGLFDGQNPTQVTRSLADPNYEINVEKIADTRLRNLVKACLRRNPRQRPPVTQIMLHSYFLTSYSPFKF